MLLQIIKSKKGLPCLNNFSRFKLFESSRLLSSDKAQKKANDYSKTLNLPNFGQFELSMKNICQNEEKIKKVSLLKHQKQNLFD